MAFRLIPPGGGKQNSKEYKKLKNWRYLLDENGKIYNPYSCSNIILNPFNLNWYFLHYNYCEETYTIVNLGQFLCENVCIAKKGPHLKSGQVPQLRYPLFRPRKIHFIIKNLEREVQLDPFWGGFELLLSIRRIYGCLSGTTTLKYPGSVKNCGSFGPFNS